MYTTVYLVGLYSSAGSGWFNTAVYQPTPPLCTPTSVPLPYVPPLFFGSAAYPFHVSPPL